MFKDEQRFRIGEIVARATTDAEFRSELLENSGNVLSENGVQLPRDIEIRFVENTKSTIYLTLPYVEKKSPLRETLDDKVLRGRATPIILNTPKDVGCCGGGSSIGAIWLEDEYDGTYDPKTQTG